MKLVKDFDNLIDTYNKLLEQCHAALDPAAPQRTRNDLRAAIGSFLEAHKSKQKPAAGGGGGD